MLCPHRDYHSAAGDWGPRARTARRRPTGGGRGLKQTSRARGRALLASALLTAALLTATALATPATAQERPFEEMCEELQAEAASFDGRISFVVHDFSDGTSCTRNPDETYITASLYKLVVLAEAHRQQEEGLFSFDERILGLLASDAIRSMIQVSSNNTARALLGRLGLDAVAALPAQLGMNDTILRGEDYTTTASDIAHFFLQLEARQLISPEADQAMLDLLLGQNIRDRIPALLPSNVPIAHKTGRLDRSAHDAGIIYAPGGAYVLVLLTEGSPSQNWNPGHEAIRQLAALSYTAYGELPAPTPTPAATPAPTGAHAQRDGDTDAQRDANALASADCVAYACAYVDSNALADADRSAHASADRDRDTLAECDRDALASGVGRWQRRHATHHPSRGCC